VFLTCLTFAFRGSPFGYLGLTYCRLVIGHSGAHWSCDRDASLDDDYGNSAKKSRPLK
jgi:hypothetical protein